MDKISAVNGQVMKWARENCNMPITFVAEKTKNSPDVIAAWEEGVDYPTYAQLEKLGGLYKKPLAVFFFSNIPEINLPKSSCRSLPEHIYDALSYKIIQKINDARVMQLNLYELNSATNPAPTLLTNMDFSQNINRLAVELRSVLNVSLKEQKTNRKDDDALEMWRNCFRNNGIYVFKEAFKDNSISGFCLCDNVFPIIYINNSMSFTRQIFTLFHEFYHLISNTSGIDKLEDNYFDVLSPDQLVIERACNKFAAEFLVPDNDFDIEIRGKKLDDLFIARLANKYNVSREVVSRKLLDRGLMAPEDYEEKHEEYIADAIRANQKKKEKDGGDHYNTKISYLGTGYLHLVFNSYKKNRIDIFQLSEYTRTKIENLPKLEARWGWRV